MIYTPESVVNKVNNMIVLVYVLSAIFIFIMAVAVVALFWPEVFDRIGIFFKNLFKGEKTVKTVYSDKSKNYSGTEFLPVPDKAPTESFEFEFLGWNKFEKDKKGNFETKPIFLKKAKICIVNVYDDKNNLLETHQVEYGAGIKIKHKLIIKEPTKEFEYQFVGWDKDTKAFFANADVHPVFKAKPIKYSYKFVLDDKETVVFEKKSIFGTPIACPTDPVKIDDEYVYEFAGWKGYKRNMLLDKDYVFEAIFDKKQPISDEEKTEKQKSAIKVALNDYKKDTKKSNEYKLQDQQKFKEAKRVVVEKTENKTREKIEKPKKEENKSLLKGVIVEKNKKKK